MKILFLQDFQILPLSKYYNIQIITLPDTSDHTLSCVSFFDQNRLSRILKESLTFSWISINGFQILFFNPLNVNMHYAIIKAIGKYWRFISANVIDNRWTNMTQIFNHRRLLFHYIHPQWLLLNNFKFFNYICSCGHTICSIAININYTAVPWRHAAAPRLFRWLIRFFFRSYWRKFYRDFSQF